MKKSQQLRKRSSTKKKSEETIRVLADQGRSIRSVAGNNLFNNFMFWKKKPRNTEENNSQKMGMLQRLAMKKVMSMDPKEREKLMQKALSPENIAKNKDKILETMEQMKASGQMTDEQMRMAKEKLGL